MGLEPVTLITSPALNDTFPLNANTSPSGVVPDVITPPVAVPPVVVITPVLVLKV